MEYKVVVRASEEKMQDLLAREAVDRWEYADFLAGTSEVIFRRTKI